VPLSSHPPVSFSLYSFTRCIQEDLDAMLLLLHQTYATSYTSAARSNEQKIVSRVIWQRALMRIS